jgi:8-amino-7-oxononanoate synthase
MRDLAALIAERRTNQLYRQRRHHDGPQGAELWHDGQRLDNFCSNDYLGLASDPRLVAALKEGADRYGVGSGAAHLVSGHSIAHHALEEALADFTQRPRSLLFSTCYMANLAVITALLDAGDAIFEDRLNHASLIDGGTMSRARFARYRHGDSADLAAKMAASRAATRLVVTDGVFSMDGDLAPLPALAATAAEHNGWLMVDDAHAIGIIGKEGRGSLNHFGLNHAQVPIYMATLGKAIGTSGAFVAGSHELIDWLVQSARPYIYTTAAPPAIAHATLTSLRLVAEEVWRREQVAERIAHFRAGAAAIGLPLAPSTTPIQPLILGTADRANRASAWLYERGVWVTAIRPPTVPEGSARLRFTLTANHTAAQVERLIALLAEWSVEQGSTQAPP